MLRISIKWANGREQNCVTTSSISRIARSFFNENRDDPVEIRDYFRRYLKGALRHGSSQMIPKPRSAFSGPSGGSWTTRRERRQGVIDSRETSPRGEPGRARLRQLSTMLMTRNDAPIDSHRSGSSSDQPSRRSGVQRGRTSLPTGRWRTVKLGRDAKIQRTLVMIPTGIENRSGKGRTNCKLSARRPITRLRFACPYQKRDPPRAPVLPARGAIKTSMAVRSFSRGSNHAQPELAMILSR